MSITNKLTQSKSVWEPQFIEEINQDICLDCDRFNEVGGSNAFWLQPMNQNGINSQDQNLIIGVVNPEQCADCANCIGNYVEKPYTHYSFSV